MLSPTSKKPVMGFAASDVVPLTQARSNLPELADQARAGKEKIITKNGESCVALMDSDRLDCYHLLLIDGARRGLADIAAGRTFEADTALARLQQRRKTAAKSAPPTLV